MIMVKGIIGFICGSEGLDSSGLSSSAALTRRNKFTLTKDIAKGKELNHGMELADVWSCGVTLYVMLVGAYPFEDQEDPKNFRKTIRRIMVVQYKIADYVHVSQDCKHLLSRIFVANPSRVVLPLHQLKAVNPSVSKGKPVEKYIQVISVDNHEFWFMAFVNYDNAIKCLQEALQVQNS